MPSSLFAGIPQCLPDELFETLYENEQVHIERIVSRGHVTPADQWYEQAKNEWVILIQGSATLLFETGEEWLLNAGDYVLIPSLVRHRVSHTAPDIDSIWLAIHF